jgi:hypothetical protein
MPGNILDNRTRTFLAVESGRLGFIGEHHQRYSLVEASGSVESWLVHTETLAVCGGTATVYELPDDALERLGLTDVEFMSLPGVADGAGELDTAGDSAPGTPDSDPETMLESGPLYAVECRPPEAGEDITAPAETTLLFDHQCTAAEVEQALRLQSIEHKLRFGSLSAEYACQDCGERVHWLGIPSDAPVDSLSLAERQRLLETRRCGCLDWAE